MSAVEFIFTCAVLCTVISKYAPAILDCVAATQSIVCYSNRDTAKSEILCAAASGEYDSLEDACEEVLNSPHYAGRICPDGGKITYRIDYDGPYATLTISCDHEGHGELADSIKK